MQRRNSGRTAAFFAGIFKKITVAFFFEFLTLSYSSGILRRHYASVAQSAEHNHGKVGVSGSIPLGSFFCFYRRFVMAKKTSVELIALQCTECKRKNYTTAKNRKNIQGKLELSKYCPFDRKHTVHKETKVK